MAPRRRFAAAAAAGARLPAPPLLLLALLALASPRAALGRAMAPYNARRSALNQHITEQADAMLASAAAQAVDGEDFSARRVVTPPPAPTTCEDLLTQVKAHTTSALLAANAAPPPAKPKPVLTTITLPCGARYNCTRPSAPKEVDRDLILQVQGAGTLTIKSVGCIGTKARPVITGGVTAQRAEFFYVGAYPVPPENTEIDNPRPIAALVLDGVDLDGTGQMDNGSPEPLRGCINAVDSAGVTFRNGALRNCVSSSSYGGGAIYGEITPVTLANVQISGSVTDGDGGAINLLVNKPVKSNIALSMTTVSISGSRAAGRGGVIAVTKTTYASVALKTLGGCSFRNNSADGGCSLLYSVRDDMNYDKPAPNTNCAGGLCGTQGLPLVTTFAAPVIDPPGAGTYLMCGVKADNSTYTYRASPVVGYHLLQPTPTYSDFIVAP